MPVELVGSTVVIVAKQFNPSIVNQLWLVQNAVLLEDEFRPGCVFTDMAVQVHASEFDLTVVPQQFQFTPKVALDRQQELVNEKVGRITQTLPHTPFRALGLNFIWQYTPDNESVADACRRLFFKEGCRLHESFNQADARFGGYMSKDFMSLRMKMDVKPATVTCDGQSVERIQFMFNFHKDLVSDENVVRRIQETLCIWNDARDAASQLVQSAARGGGQ